MANKKKGEKKALAQRMDRDPKTGRFKKPKAPPQVSTYEHFVVVQPPANALEYPKLLAVVDARSTNIVYPPPMEV